MADAPDTKQAATWYDQERQRCPRDSDWCDGIICREHGIECPNAEPDITPDLQDEENDG